MLPPPASETSTCPLKFHSRIVIFGFFIYTGCKSLVRYMFYKYFLPIYSLIFFTILLVFTKNKAFNFDKSNLSFFFFLFWLVFLCSVSEILVYPKAMHSLFLTRSFSVLAFTSTSVICLGLTFLCDDLRE